LGGKPRAGKPYFTLGLKKIHTIPVNEYTINRIKTNLVGTHRTDQIFRIFSQHRELELVEFTREFIAAIHVKLATVEVFQSRLDGIKEDFTCLSLMVVSLGDLLGAPRNHADGQVFGVLIIDVVLNFFDSHVFYLVPNREVSTKVRWVYSPLPLLIKGYVE
jgi:hypothetical protein